MNYRSKPSLSKASFDMGTAVTIYTNRQSSIATHTLRYSFFSANGTIATGVTTSCAWTPSVSLAAQIPNATSGWGTIFCDTYVNGSLVSTNTCAFQLTVQDVFYYIEQTVSIGTKQVMMDFYKDGSGIAFGKVAENAGKVEFGWPLLLSEPLGVDQGGTGAETASAACTKLGAVKKAGDTMTGNLAISGYLYPSLYLLPTYNSTTNRTVFEGSYLGASSFSSWEDSTGNNRRMLEVRNAAYQASLDFAVLLRTCTGGTWASYRLFHAGMATPIPLANGGTGASDAETARANLGVNNAANLTSGTISSARLPFKIAYGSTTINGNSAVNISYA